jgi:hypothetical protein
VSYNDTKVILVNFETTHTFDQSAKKLARKSLRHLNEDFNRMKQAMAVMTFDDIKRKYHFEPYQEMPSSEKYKGYKQSSFKSTDERSNVIRLLVCAEFAGPTCVKLTFVDIHNDDDHTDNRLKNKMKATLHNFIEEQISKDKTNSQ